MQYECDAEETIGKQAGVEIAERDRSRGTFEGTGGTGERMKRNEIMDGHVQVIAVVRGWRDADADAVCVVIVRGLHITVKLSFS